MGKKNKKPGKNKFHEDDEAVSPVIGVILLVAITVVMAAIVSSWGAGVKAPTTPTTLGLDIERSGTNITITITAIDPITAAPVPNISARYTNSTFGYYNYSYINSANVGDSTIIYTNESGPNLLTVAATYKDGSKKVIYNQRT